MSLSTALIDVLPDLILELKRDGRILSYAGGLEVQALRLSSDAAGKTLADVYPVLVAELLKQLSRRVLSSRTSCETEFLHQGMRYEVRISARSADRALCVIRA